VKFLLLIHIFPPAIDGGTSHLYSLGQCLKNQSHQIYYFSSNCHSADDFITPKTAPVPTSAHRLPVYRHLYRLLKLIHPILTKGPVFKILPFLKTLVTIHKFHPDYLIAGPFSTTVNLTSQSKTTD
jgi:hypothetical protein